MSGLEAAGLLFLLAPVAIVLLWRRAGRSRRFERRLEHSTIERLTGHGAGWEVFDGRRWPNVTDVRK